MKRSTDRKNALVRIFFLLVLIGMSQPLSTSYAADPPCLQNLFRPFVLPDTCPELLLDDFGAVGMVGIGAIRFGPDDALYFTSPGQRAVYRMEPDGRGFFNAPIVVVSDLREPPFGLIYDSANKAWIVTGDTTISRILDGRVQPLVENLPGGAGGWLGHPRIGPDGRLYVGKAARCDTCQDEDRRRGALLSFTLDGSDPQIVATGLRNASAFDWNPADDKLFIVDDERSGLAAELNILEKPSADFGWPFCGSDGHPIAGVSGANEERCVTTIRPALTLDPDSHPSDVKFYRGDAFPNLKDSLLIGLAGSWNAPILSGYELIAVKFEAGKSPAIQRVIPGYLPLSSSDLTVIRASFYPYRISGIAVDSRGWIYTAISEGRIYRFRPKP